MEIIKIHILGRRLTCHRCMPCLAQKKIIFVIQKLHRDMVMNTNNALKFLNIPFPVFSMGHSTHSLRM